MAAYGASKAGIINLTQTLALEWAPYIRVNCIAPGVIETPGSRWSRETMSKDAGSADEQLAAVAKSIPLGRLGQVEDVAATAVYLASEAASWVTGVTIDITGGPIRG